MDPDANNQPQPGQAPTPTPTPTPAEPVAPVPTTSPNSGEALAPATAATATPPEKKRMPKWVGILIGVIAGLVVLGGIGLAILLVSIGSSLARPVAVSNQFVDAVQANDASAAYALASDAFKAATTESSLEAIINRVSEPLTGDEKIISQNVTTKNGVTTAEIEYSVENGGNTYYILMNLQENDGVWQVQSFQSDDERSTKESE